ncbi:DUF4435 domain-containing protein [Leyella stercorea]|uniref:DUF4435 domain-containing protein n=1 Tax=Leyella stercorea TaxID=363265 RepID=UPI00266DD43B|nr:DUF4435 domain-containing protein [Leyella stercorea]
MDRIYQQAQYFSNLPLRDRSIKAVVHLEDSDDVPFWSNQLRNIHPAKYRFLTYSKNGNGTDSRGCEQCLRYKPYLNKRFFICIDSDLRQLKGEQGLTANNNVAQTYAYSWENHFCEAEHLQERFTELVSDSDFDFKVFLHNLSVVVYRPLIYLVHYSRCSELNQQWNITKFNSCLPLQPKRDELEDNGKGYIGRVTELFDEKISGLQQPEEMTNEYIDEANAYLHIHGHQLYKLVLQIGSMLCKGKGVAFKTEILDKAVHTEGYNEIENVQLDLMQILV